MYCSAIITTPEIFKRSVKFLFQKTNPKTRLLTLNQLYQSISKSCGFSSFQQLQRAPEIFIWVNEITSLINGVDESESLDISSSEISDLFSCDIMRFENNGGIGVLIFNDNVVCKIPISTESKPYYANGIVYDLPINRGIHMSSENWNDFIYRVQKQIDNIDIDIDIEDFIELEWSTTDFTDCDEIYLTNYENAYKNDLVDLTEGQFRKLVCEQSIYSPACAVYELLDIDRE